MGIEALAPVTLAGQVVELQPLTLAHVPALAEAGTGPELWRWQPAPIETEDDMRRYVERALADQQQGLALPFAIVLRADGRIVGSTRYMDIALPHRRLEIGATWLAPSAQRTGANTEAKWLLLKHAFDTLRLQKVVFKTETLNEQSRRAILRLGAVEEGIFRRHLITSTGRARDMVYFSILDTDWPAVDERLRQSLAKARLPRLPDSALSSVSGEPLPSR
jgi:RimJ/RimL family protein N-acetyltransferase